MVEAIATTDHKTNDPEFVSFQDGDVLKIIEMDVQIDDMSWYRAFVNGRLGLVSDSMIDIKPYRWFWVGTMSRLDAEAKLLENDQEFLIRQTQDGRFYVSYKSQTHEKKVWHFALDYNQECVTFSFFKDWKGEKKVFFSLTELAHFIKVYGRHTLLRWEPGPDEEDLIAAREQRRARWSSN